MDVNEVAEPGQGVVCPSCREQAAAVTDRFCEGCGTELTLPLDPATDRVEIDLQLLAGVSDRGLVHVRNEDAMALGRRPEQGPPRVLAAVVCDGVSTVRRPELASRTATAVALDVLLDGAGPATGEERMRIAVAAAADAVASLAPDSPDAPACTLVAALLSGSQITVGWVGDSRAYWLADEGPTQLTADHSWVVEMVSSGVLDVADAMRDPRAHAILRWLGAGSTPEPGITTFTPDGPGALLLCSDGLWNYAAGPPELAALALPALTRDGPGAAARALTAFAIGAGGRDNVTAVCIPFSRTTWEGETL